MDSRDASEFSDELLPFQAEHQNCPRSLHERLTALLNQGSKMLFVLRDHVCEHAPSYASDMEYAIMCYHMITLHLDDYFDTVGRYVSRTVAQKDLKWWPDLMFRWVASVVFSVLEKVDIQTLDYYVNLDNLRQVFRHLQWSNLLFNWKCAKEYSC